MYILILLFWGPLSGITQNIEFSSLESCTKAAEALKIQIGNRMDNKVMFCIKK